MILTNEIVRPTIKEKPYSLQGVTAMNSSIQTKDKCTWNCAANTTYCKQNHVKYVKQYFEIIDPIYFGIIRLLAATGNYGLANIIFLVILWPLVMYYLLIKSFDMNARIKELKRR